MGETDILIYKIVVMILGWAGLKSEKNPQYYYTMAIVFSLFAILDKLP